MSKSLTLLFCLLSILTSSISSQQPASNPQAELAIAIRYLQAEGTSHSHVYLYREDGKLLRQLSRDNVGQDRDPFFSPDGKSVVFTREMQTGLEFWMVNPLGKTLHKLDTAPDWYLNSPAAPYFQYPETTTASSLALSTPPKFTTPDETTQITLQTIQTDEDDSINGPGHGKHYLLQDMKSGRKWEMGEFEGFVGLASNLQLGNAAGGPFLLEPPLLIAFFALHLNSTDGDTTFALDLDHHKIVNLSPNWAAPFPLPGEPAFLTLTSVRYVTIPGSSKTANCSYIERWNKDFLKIRYAEEGSAAICYGASLYRPGQSPRTLYLPKDRN
ncbi:hypothetical protein BH11VER1_BH11VER1_11730 [soil metagenome]